MDLHIGNVFRDTMHEVKPEGQRSYREAEEFAAVRSGSRAYVIEKALALLAPFSPFTGQYYAPPAPNESPSIVIEEPHTIKNDRRFSPDPRDLQSGYDVIAIDYEIFREYLTINRMALLDMRDTHDPTNIGNDLSAQATEAAIVFQNQFTAYFASDQYDPSLSSVESEQAAIDAAFGYLTTRIQFHTGSRETAAVIAVQYLDMANVMYTPGALPRVDVLTEDQLLQFEINLIPITALTRELITAYEYDFELLRSRALADGIPTVEGQIPLLPTANDVQRTNAALNTLIERLNFASNGGPIPNMPDDLTPVQSLYVQLAAGLPFADLFEQYPGMGAVLPDALSGGLGVLNAFVPEFKVLEATGNPDALNLALQNTATKLGLQTAQVEKIVLMGSLAVRDMSISMLTGQFPDTETNKFLLDELLKENGVDPNTLVNRVLDLTQDFSLDILIESAKERTEQYIPYTVVIMTEGVFLLDPEKLTVIQTNIRIDDVVSRAVDLTEAGFDLVDLADFNVTTGTYVNKNSSAYGIFTFSDHVIPAVGAAGVVGVSGIAYLAYLKRRKLLGY